MGFDLIPQGLSLDANGASGYPRTTGTRLKYTFSDRVYLQAGAYNGNVKQRNGDQHGVDFSLRGRCSRSQSLGCGGTMARRILAYNSEKSERHLGIFGAFTAQPQARLNTVPYFFDAGVAAYGPSAERPRDFAALGIVYSSFKNTPQGLLAVAPLITPSSNEETLEATYGFVVRPGCSFSQACNGSFTPGATFPFPARCLRAARFPTLRPSGPISSSTFNRSWCESISESPGSRAIRKLPFSFYPLPSARLTTFRLENCQFDVAAFTEIAEGKDFRGCGGPNASEKSIERRKNSDSPP